MTDAVSGPVAPTLAESAAGGTVWAPAERAWVQRGDVSLPEP